MNLPELFQSLQQKVNWVDIFVVILLIRSSYIGFTRGFSWELFRFSGLVGAALADIYFYEYGSQLISDYFPSIYPVANLISFTAIYAVILLISRILTLFIEKFIKLEVFSALERFGGLIFGFLYGVILLSLILITLIFTPIPYFEKSVKERAYSGRAVSQAAPFLYDKAALIFPALKFGGRNEALFKLTGLEARPPAVLEKAKNIKKNREQY